MLTICLIAKNEGPNVQGCLASFRLLSETFLLVDTGSTDDTKKIAKDLGAEVLDFEWVDDFSAARNFALSNVKTPWVLMIDADYRISEEDVKKLKHFLNEEKEKWDVVDLRTEFDGTYAYLPKLWRTELNLQYVSPVHEYLLVPNTLRRKKLELSLLDPLPRDHHSSRKRYVEIMERHVAKHPDDHRMLYYLISDNRFLKRYKESVLWGEKYLAADPPSDNQLARALVHVGKSLLALGKRTEAEQAFQAAQNFASDLAEPYLRLGDLHFAKGEYVQALDCYFKAGDCPFKIRSFHQTKDHYTFEPKWKLARTFAKLNEKEKALQYAEEALKLKPEHKALNELFHTLTQSS